MFRIVGVFFEVFIVVGNYGVWICMDRTEGSEGIKGTEEEFYSGLFIIFWFLRLSGYGEGIRED